MKEVFINSYIISALMFNNKKELDIASKIEGEVRIPLSAYHKLISNYVSVEDTRGVYEKTMKSIGDALNSIRKNDIETFNRIVKEFNSSSDTLSIYVDDYNTVRMGMRQDKT